MGCCGLVIWGLWLSLAEAWVALQVLFRLCVLVVNSRVVSAKCPRGYYFLVFGAKANRLSDFSVFEIGIWKLHGL